MLLVNTKSFVSPVFFPSCLPSVVAVWPEEAYEAQSKLCWLCSLMHNAVWYLHDCATAVDNSKGMQCLVLLRAVPWISQISVSWVAAVNRKNENLQRPQIENKYYALLFASSYCMKFYMTFQLGCDPYRFTLFSHSFCLPLEVLIILGHHFLYILLVADYFHICVLFLFH